MTMADSHLVVHLRLDEAQNNVVTDASGNGRHGQLVGQPQLIADATFGTCLSLSGNNQSVMVADANLVAPPEPGQPTPPTNAARNPPHTVAGWVWLNSYPTSRSWILHIGQAGAGAHHWLVSPNGNAALGVWSGSQFGPKLPLGAWTHLATTFDGTQLRCYLNGTPVAAPQAASFNFSNYSLALGRPSQSEAHFAGKLAGIRLYSRALSADEVAQILADDRTALAAFRRSHPIEFSLHDADNQPLLAIVDNPTGQRVELEVINRSNQTITLSAPLTAAAGRENYHFELRFRPGVLASGSTPIAVAETGWQVARLQEPDGSVSLFLLATASQNLAPGAILRLNLLHLAADGRGGARGTRTELHYGRMSYQGETLQLTGYRTQHLSIVNHRGQKHIPLHLGLVGSHTLVNNGVDQTLTLRLVNAGRQAIRLATPASRPQGYSMLVLSFDAPDQADPDGLWALGTDAQVRRIVPTAPGWVCRNTAEGNNLPRWELTPDTMSAFDPGQELLVTLTPVATTLRSGHTNIYLHYQNIDGFWDGQLICPLEKRPLIIKDIETAPRSFDYRVGVGTAQPRAKLEVAGGAIMPSAGNTETSGIMFPKDPGGGTSDAAWLRYYARQGEATTLELGTTNDPEDHIALMASGGVGVGTNAPEGKLQVLNTPQDAFGNTLVLGPTNASHLRLGYHQNYSWIQSHSGKPLAINPMGNNVGIGTSEPVEQLQLGHFRSPGERFMQIAVEGTAGGRSVTGLKLKHWGDGFGFTIRSDDNTNPPGLSILRHHDSAPGVVALFINRATGTVGVNSSTAAARLAINGGLHVGGDSDPGDDNLLVDGRIGVGGDINSSYIQKGATFNIPANTPFRTNSSGTFFASVNLANGLKLVGTSGGVLATQTREVLYWSDINNIGEVIIKGKLWAQEKNFLIDHPSRPGYQLAHSCIEGPEVAVYYRGSAQLHNGRATITLPAYFEALTRPNGRTVLLTPRGREPFGLSYDTVADGAFTVYAERDSGMFDWEVKAIRADVGELVVERHHAH